MHISQRNPHIAPNNNREPSLSDTVTLSALRSTLAPHFAEAVTCCRPARLGATAKASEPSRYSLGNS
jgi:hypothetical protein